MLAVARSTRRKGLDVAFRRAAAAAVKARPATSSGESMAQERAFSSAPSAECEWVALILNFPKPRFQFSRLSTTAGYCCALYEHQIVSSHIILAAAVVRHCCTAVPSPRRYSHTSIISMISTSIPVQSLRQLYTAVYSAPVPPPSLFHELEHLRSRHAGGVDVFDPVYIRVLIYAEQMEEESRVRMSTSTSMLQRMQV